MAGFASFFGGLGNAAEQYGAQVRPILERQREGYAALLGKQAEEEGNPDYRNQLLKLSADAVSGQPLHKIIPAHQKLLESMQLDHQASQQLHQALNPQAEAPPKIPGPQAGSAPGTGYSSLLGAAAQPQSSPVSPTQQTTNQVESAGRKITGDTGGPIPQVQAQAAQPTPQIPPVTVTPQAQDPRAMRNAILQEYNQKLMQATPAMRPYIKNEMDMALGQLQPFEQQAARSAGFNQFKNTDEYKALPTYVQGEHAASSFGLPPVSAPGGFFTPRLLSTGSLGEQAPPGTVEYGTHTPVKHGTRYRVEVIPGTGETIWTPETAQTGVGQTAGGMQIYDKNTGNVIAPIAGAVPPSMNSQIKEPTANGGVQVTSRAELNAGASPQQIPGAVSPNMLPSVTQSQRSIQTIDPTTGQPVTHLEPVTSTRSKGGSPSQFEVPASADGRPGFSVPMPAPPSSGGRDFPKFSENQMTAQGQKDITQIDDVLTQIHNLKQMMEQRGWDKQDNKDYYPDYVRYMHLGQSSPNQDIYTALSFEGLRSAATALRSTNSRALPIISRALEHTPNPAASLTSMHLPDSPKSMYGKLTEMEQILSNGRQAVMSDEKKSGVVPPVTGAKSGPVQWKRDANGRPVPSQ